MGDGWRDLDGWPPSGSTPVDWYLHSGGRANSKYGDGALTAEPPGDEPSDVFVYDPLAPVASAGGHSCCDDAVTPMGPEVAARGRALGRHPRLHVGPARGRHRPDRRRDGVAPRGIDRRRHGLHGQALPRRPGRRVGEPQAGDRARPLRESRSAPSPIEPARVYEYRIDLGPLGARIPAGYRLRLDVSSSDFPHWDRNLNTGGPLGREGPEAAVVATQTVLHDRLRPSRLTLPVVTAS